jgi:hypothetical protein
MLNLLQFSSSVGVKIMYSVVYWTKEGNYLNIAQNKDDSVWIANTIKEADAKAEEIEKQSGVEDARTISLESISE